MKRFLCALIFLSLLAGHAIPVTADSADQFLCGGVVAGFTEEREPIPQRLQMAEVPVTVSPGGGTLTFSVDESVDPAYAQYILDLLLTVYPVAVRLYGPPVRSRHVVVHFDDSTPGWFWYSNGRIIISSYPRITLPYTGTTWALPNNDPRWDAVVTHEMLHAFHDGISLSASWNEEGMTEAGAELVGEYLWDERIRDILGRTPQHNLLMYDVWSQMGADVLGGTPYAYYKAVPDLFYRTVPAVFWMLLSGEADALAGSWADYTFLADLNQALYEYAATHSALIPDSIFYEKIASLSPYPVDGLPAAAWVQSQPIVSTAGSEGTFLAVYPVQVTIGRHGRSICVPMNPTRLYTFAFTRSGEGWAARETLILSRTVQLSVYDIAGRSVWEGSVTLSKPTDDTCAYAGIDTTAWPMGAYKLTATLDLGTGPIRAENYFYVGPDTTLAEQGLGLVLTDSQGRLSDVDPSSPDATVLFSQSSAAVLLPHHTGRAPLNVRVFAHLNDIPPPSAPYTLYLPVAQVHSPAEALAPTHTVTVPLPYTRVKTLVIAF
ncbi:MAG: hypothetical protein H5T64_12685 [Chloroflexi bacterium]|nr:hypothetical protein [Chloroflexota bacterium]